MKDIINEEIPKKGIGIWWIGQGGFVFKTSSGKIIIVDPYLSHSVEASKKNSHKRMMKIPFQPQEVTTDVILCTHDHLDHTDPDTLTKVKTCRLVGPSSCCEHFRKMRISEDRIITLNRGEEKEIDGIIIKAVKAFHTSDSIGYLIRVDDINIYITGDTAYNSELKKEVSFLKIDVLIACINNGKLGIMDYYEAAVLTEEVNPVMVIAMHFGMFKEQGICEPEKFLDELKKKRINSKVLIPEFNKFFLYKRLRG